jgi:D-serine deaminase-like pyridoxal phosphate-dependent protein
MNPSTLFGKDVREVDTPALLIDADALDRNLERMAKFAAAKKLNYRPHVKTHKTPLIARRQMAAGACGICCAKLGEAEVMVDGGIDDILVTTPVTGVSKVSRLVTLAARARIAVVVDNAANISELSEAVKHSGVSLGVFVEVNVGQNRCGVESGPEAARLGVMIAKAGSLHLRGLQGYQGALQGVVDFATRSAAVKQALERLHLAATHARQAGLEIETLTGGGTGSLAIDAALGGLTELQPGSYVFMDASYDKIQWDAEGAASPFEPALSILASVVSRPAADRVIVDVGWKSASSDAGVPLLRSSSELSFAFAGDEHGVVQTRRGAIGLDLGDRLELQPSHCDTTVNLYDSYVVVKNGAVFDVWDIAGRGRSQ